jgi:hypothetical protein
MKALVYNALCFDETEIERFGPISGGIFLTQVKYNSIANPFPYNSSTTEIKLYIF